jgi:trans-aconitate 2-methyltransferase
MIARARQTYPQGDWILADISTWKTESRYDLVFSNAALQWVPDHTALIPALFDLVQPGGALAVQVPANTDSPLYQAIVSVARRDEWRSRLAGCERIILYLPPGFYYDVLSELSDHVVIWQTTYYHRMASHQGLIDWYAGTGLRPYLERLPAEEDQTAFKQQILDECRPQYPRQADGQILFPFKRTFFIAYKHLPLPFREGVGG